MISLPPSFACAFPIEASIFRHISEDVPIFPNTSIPLASSGQPKERGQYKSDASVHDHALMSCQAYILTPLSLLSLSLSLSALSLSLCSASRPAARRRDPILSGVGRHSAGHRGQFLILCSLLPEAFPSVSFIAGKKGSDVVVPPCFLR